MECRKCPQCGKKIYSAAVHGDWDCPHCGAVVPEEGQDNKLQDNKV